MANLFRAGTRPGQGTATAESKSSGRGKALIGNLFNANKVNETAMGAEGTGEGGEGAASKRYSAAHPILDALFNEGRAGAAADARNFQRENMETEHNWRTDEQKAAFAHSRQLITDHLDAGKQLAKYNNELATDGYSKQLQAKLDFAKKEFEQTRGQAIQGLKDAGHTTESAVRQLGVAQDTAQRSEIAKNQGLINTAQSKELADNAANNAAAAASKNLQTRSGIESEALAGNRGTFIQESLDRAQQAGLGNAASKASTAHTQALTEEVKNPFIKMGPNEVGLRLGSNVKSVTTVPGAFDPSNPMAARPLSARFQYDLSKPTSVLGTPQSSASEGTNTQNQPKSELTRTAAQPAPVKQVLSKAEDPVYTQPEPTQMPDPFGSFMQSPFGQELSSMGDQLKSGYNSAAETAGQVGDLLKQNTEGVDILGNFRKTPLGRVLSKRSY